MIRRSFDGGPAVRALNFFLLFLVLSTCPGRPALAQQGQPILRIETGTHSAGVGDAAVDAAGRIMVTVSDDKTARIWSLPDLRQLFVIRPDIGSGQAGVLYTAAISPDGRLVAIGGFRPEVLLFDVASKELVQRWPDVPNSVLSLAFSADGNRLAAGLAKGGLRVWNVTTRELAAQDTEYDGGIYGLSFAKDGRLVTSCINGTLQVYDASGRLTRRATTELGRRPFQVRFNPSGKLIAAGFIDAFAVEVHDADSLAIKTKPSLGMVKGKSLSRVAWGSDGSTLFAGGNSKFGNSNPVFAWSNSGGGEARRAAIGFPDSVGAILPLPDGHLVTVSREGDMAVVAANGKSEFERKTVAQDLNVGARTDDPSRQLRLARDGKRVQWMPFGAVMTSGTKPRWLTFDTENLDLAVMAAPSPDTANWLAEAGALHVADWDDGLTPRLNDRQLGLKQGERAESVSVQDQRVLLGTHFGIHAFDDTGREAWVATSGPTYRVNQSGDGRVVVAAVDDGTIRWYRASDGLLLLSLFVTADGDRWIAYTPQGYYAASPGGEDLIGWHIGNGADRLADFFGASRLRDRFYRPDVVSRALVALDPLEALAQANAAKGTNTTMTTSAIDSTDLPPVIKIISPADGTQVTGDEVVVEYAFRSPSGQPVDEITTLMDGRPADLTRSLAPSAPALPEGTRQRGLAPAADPGEIRARVAVAVPAGREVEISLLAETANHRKSEPAHVRVTGRPASRQIVAVKRLNAVLVGISKYPDPRNQLMFAAKDVADIAKVLDTQRGAGLYNEINVKVLTDEAATRGNILKALNWLRQETRSDDTGVVFLSGHGVPEEGQTFFLTYDAEPGDLAATAVTQSDLKNVLSRVPGKVIAFIDICHAGSAVLQQGKNSVVDMTSFVNIMREPGTGLIVFASATSYQPAEERAELQNGVFTSALKEGLLGGADFRRKGAIRTDELNTFLNERVAELTQDRQHPVMQRPSDVPDFAFMARKQ
jgi:WD40 repeat protein